MDKYAVRRLCNDDIRILQDFLYPYKSQCMFICSNLKASAIEYKDEPFYGEYWGCFHKNSKSLKGVIVHYWNNNIMMFAPDKVILKKLIQKLKVNITRPIQGVLGPNNQAEFVMENLNLLNKSYSINSNDALYEMDLNNLDNQVLPLNYRVIDCREVSKTLIIRWMQNYNAEALGIKGDYGLQQAEDKTNGLMGGDCWVLTENGIPVSLSAFNARFDDRVQLGPFYTPPEYRNKGFAKLLVEYTLNEVKIKGARKTILFTNNAAAMKVYECIGFKSIGNYRLALLEKPILLY